jgi:large subunit ribosomal protein L14e
MTIVDVVDKNHVIVDSPLKDSRMKINMNNIQLTKFKLEFLYGARSATVIKAWAAADMNAKWAETTWAKNIAKKSLRANLGDFERFSVMKLKQTRRHIIKNTKA